LRPIKIAILGFGKIAADQHVPSIAGNDRLELVASSSRSGQGVVQAFTDWRQLIRSVEGLQAVAITTPPGPRYEIARECILAGLHCLLEKPPTAGLAEINDLACLAEEGRHVSIAVQRGATTEIPIFDIMRRRLTLTGSTLRPRPVEFKTMVADEISRTVWPYVEGGRLKPVIDATFPLAEADAAHARMESGGHVGKIVLTVRE